MDLIFWFMIAVCIISLVMGFFKIRLRHFRPIAHHGGILRMLPYCDRCMDQVRGLGIQSGRYPLISATYHISCWLKQLLSRY